MLRRGRLSRRRPTTRGRSAAITHSPNCPWEVMDVLLAPDQMILQIHKSIGHPLELDRIWGDERNYAGTGFVTPDMFGTYRYGSDFLNITFDPTRPQQYVSYGFDDDGQPAQHRLDNPGCPAACPRRSDLRDTGGCTRALPTRGPVAGTGLLLMVWRISTWSLATPPGRDDCRGGAWRLYYEDQLLVVD